MKESSCEHTLDTTLPERHRKPLREAIQTALDDYFEDLDGHKSCNLYQMVLAEIEPPLLKSVLRHTCGNQSRAAEILGMNRNTLRKKLDQYGLEKM